MDTFCCCVMGGRRSGEKAPLLIGALAPAMRHSQGSLLLLRPVRRRLSRSHRPTVADRLVARPHARMHSSSGSPCDNMSDWCSAIRRATADPVCVWFHDDSDSIKMVLTHIWLLSEVPCLCYCEGVSGALHQCCKIRRSNCVDASIWLLVPDCSAVSR